MTFIEVFLIELVLALDAFALSLCIATKHNISKKGKRGFKISFAFFQIVLTFMGICFGMYFKAYVAKIPNAISGFIIAFVGVMMIKESIENNDSDKCILDNLLMYIILGISVNIDAVVVGFTALSYVSTKKIILFNSLLGGIINYILTSIAFFIGKSVTKVKNSEKYTGYLGGGVLILLGLKMMFT